jgi:hypothetical protein
MSHFTFRKNAAAKVATYAIAIAGILALINSCNKSAPTPAANNTANQEVVQAVKTTEQLVGSPLSSSDENAVVKVAHLRKAEDGTTTEVMFNELAELFTVTDAAAIARLEKSLTTNTYVKITFNAWSGVVKAANSLSMQESAAQSASPVLTTPGIVRKIDLSRDNTDEINNTNALGIIDRTSPGLTNIIPDLATANLMFDYITRQCCAVAGPYGIDQCISFQYCQDGCYARAHKMCYIINNRYNYATHKIFSFANSGSDRLSVKALKWGGCCITWWYHVAPLVNVNTPTGVKAYVFDPAMFNQPVLLATWLHFQENPACSGTARVSMINIQPTASYSPSGYSGYIFNTDPTYSSTNSTLRSYSRRITCP